VVAWLEAGGARLAVARAHLQSLNRCVGHAQVALPELLQVPRALGQTFRGGKGEADDAQLVGLALLGGWCPPVDSRGLDERVERVRFVPPGAEDSTSEHRDEQRGLHCTQPVAESVLVGCEDQCLCSVVSGLAGMEGSVSLKRLRRGLVARHVVPTLAAHRAAEIGPPRGGGVVAGCTFTHDEMFGEGHYQRTPTPDDTASTRE